MEMDKFDYAPLFKLDKAQAYHHIDHEIAAGLALPFTPRKDQLYLIREIVDAFCSGYRNVMIDAPTGTGKSIIGMAVVSVFNNQLAKAYYIPPTRLLQTQAIEDFRSLSQLRVFKGRANYKCQLYCKPDKELYKTDEAPCLNILGDMTKNFMMEPKTIRKNKPVTDHPEQDKAVSENAADFAKNFPAVDEDVATAVSKGKFTGLKQIKACRDNGTCSYYTAREEAEFNRLCVFNLKGYLVWNTWCERIPIMKPRTLNVFDECHNIESQARDLFEIRLTEKWLHDTFKDNIPPFESWLSDDEKKKLIQNPLKYAWDNKVLEEILRYAELKNNAAIERKMSSYGFDNLESFKVFCSELEGDLGKDLQRHVRLMNVIENYRKSPNGDYVLAMDGKKDPHRSRTVFTLRIAPVMLPKQLQNIYGDYNLFMSATIPSAEIFCQEVRIPFEKTKVIRAPSLFSAKNRPIFCDTKHSLSQDYFKTVDKKVVYRDLADQIIKIVRHFKGTKGIIFASGYDMIEEMTHNLMGEPRIILARRGENDLAVKKHMTSKDGTFLMSPAIREGYDFKNDLSRVQIFTKCPFPYFGDPVIAAKAARNRLWYHNETVIQLEQALGRSQRNADDYCVTVMLDGKIPEFMAKRRNLFHPHVLEPLQPPTKHWSQVSIDAAGITY